MKKKLQELVVIATAVCGCFVHASAQTWNQTGDAVAGAATKLGTTNAFPLNLTTNNVSRLVIDASGKVGVGTAPALSLMTLKGAGSTPSASWISSGAPLFAGFGETTPGNADFNLMMASATVNARGVMGMKRARGTLAAPAAVTANDQLGSLLVSGFDGTNFQGAAAVDFFADGAVAAGSVPARISFVTGTSGSTRVERLKIASGGDVTVTTGNLGLTAGNLNMNSGAKTIQFATPLSTGGTAMMSMFPSGSTNADRMVIQHSPAFPTWGLRYSDLTDKFDFLSNGESVLTAHLGLKTVGIGTTNPTLAKLVTEGAAGNTVALFRGTSTGKGLSLITDWPGVYFNSYFNGSQLAMAPGYCGLLNFDTDNGNLYMGTSPTAAVAAGDVTTSPAQLLINKNGDVGVGTGSPTSRLHVVSASTATTPTVNVASSYVGSVDVRGVNSLSKTADGYGYGVYGTGGYMGGYFFADGGAYTGSDFGVYGYASGTAGTRYGVYGTATGGTDNWGGYFPTKTYTNELRVGGTQGATGFVASINGKLIATEIRVQPTANWPDYVFGKDHNLMSLEALEASINANKHLPGIPSAAEVKDNGIMVGEMQTKAMEKIEENTLYILQLNNKLKDVEKINSDKTKEMEQLNHKINELEQKIDALIKLIK